jgi:lysophospholipase L1-like esterase
MALVLAGFLAAILLLECDGLVNWADHLEQGPLRTSAVPVTLAFQRVARPFGASIVRTHALLALARVGWSDDAALLAAADASNTRSGSAQGCCGSAANGRTSASGCAAPAPHNLFLNAAGAHAPLLPVVPRSTMLMPLPPVMPGKPRVVALAGDSMMAVGLSATMLRQVVDNRNLRVIKAFRSGTGLARPEVFNWMDEYPAMLGAEKPDVVIVAIGANDGQGFVVDGKVLAYGTDGWERVYQERLASYLAMLSSTGARVVWVGLPPMRVASYNEKIATINRIAYTVVSQHPEAMWFNPVSYVSDEAASYREFVTLPDGRTMRIRASDGIHLSDDGAGLLTSVLVRWLDPPVQTASQGAPAPSHR